MKLFSIIRKSIAILIFLIIFIVLMVIKNNPDLAEFYTTNISTNYIQFISQITSNIPFSLYEWIFIILVISCIYYIVSIIVKLCKRKFLKSLNRFLSFLVFVLVFLDIYIGTASISYGRDNVAIPLYEGEVDQQLIDDTFNYFLNDYNEISTHFERNEDGTIISPYTFSEINDLLINEFSKLDSNYFSEFTPKAKQLTFSSIFTELHFTGVFFAPTGEASINNQLSAVELPHTMAHEIAHSKGIFREDDANLVAMYVTLTSENEYLRYSSYYHNFSSLLRIYAQTDYDKYLENYFLLNEDIRTEYGAISKFWNDHNFFAKVGQFFNDIYLKINGNKDGIKDYIDDTQSEDSGEKDENDKPIYVIKEHSSYSKLFFYLYKQQNQ